MAMQKKSRELIAANPYAPSTVGGITTKRRNCFLIIVACALFSASIPFLYGCYLGLSVIPQERPAVGFGNDGTPLVNGLIFAFVIAPIVGVFVGIVGLIICVIASFLRSIVQKPRKT
jgi:hypothetical protein